jgi:hypothetical protein
MMMVVGGLESSKNIACTILRKIWTPRFNSFLFSYNGNPKPQQMISSSRLQQFPVAWFFGGDGRRGETVFARERGKFFNPKKQQHKCGRWSMQGSTLSELTAKIFFLRSSNCFLASAN